MVMALGALSTVDCIPSVADLGYHNPNHRGLVGLKK